MYASDSLLNQYKHLDNIYDEPNVDIDYLYDENYFNVIKSKFPKSYDVQYHGSSQKKKTPPKSVLYSPLHHHPGSNLSTSNRPNSRNSLNSRLSSSHNSLSVPTANKADDSIFITQAMSHDALIGREISDFYNVPIDSDIYALPVDVIKPDLINLENRISGSSSKSHRNKLKHIKNNKKKRRNLNNNNSTVEELKTVNRLKITKTTDKRNSVPEEQQFQTSDDIKRYYQRLYSSSSDSSEAAITNCAIHNKKNVVNNLNNNNNSVSNHNKIEKNYSNHQQQNKTAIQVKTTKTTVNLKTKKISTKDDTTTTTNTINNSAIKYNGVKKSQFSINLKQKFCSIFRFRKSPSHSVSNINNSIEYGTHKANGDLNLSADNNESSKKVKFSTRALPPLPCKGEFFISFLYYKIVSFPVSFINSIPFLLSNTNVSYFPVSSKVTSCFVHSYIIQFHPKVFFLLIFSFKLQISEIISHTQVLSQLLLPFYSQFPKIFSSFCIAPSQFLTSYLVLYKIFLERTNFSMIAFFYQQISNCKGNRQ